MLISIDLHLAYNTCWEMHCWKTHVRTFVQNGAWQAATMQPRTDVVPCLPDVCPTFFFKNTEFCLMSPRLSYNGSKLLR